MNHERTRSAQVAALAFADLMAALNGQKEMSLVLASLFTSHKPGRTVTVARTCRGCPADSHGVGWNGLSYQIPAGIAIERVVEPQIELWRKRFPWLDGRPTVVLYTTTEISVNGDVVEALKALVAMFGVREVAASSEEWERQPKLRGLYQETPEGILIAQCYGEYGDPMDTLPIPRATVLSPWRGKTIPDDLLMLDRPLHIIFAPEETPSAHPLRLYRDDATNCIRLRDFLEIATQ